MESQSPSPDLPLKDLEVEDIFKQAIEMMFDVHTPCTGNIGDILSRSYDNEKIKIVYSIPDVLNTALFAYMQWDAGLILADSIAISSKNLYNSIKIPQIKAANVNGLQVLELNAGTGLPSLVASNPNLGGAKSVVVTDYPDELVMSALEKNIKMSNVQNICKVEPLDWASVTHREAIVQKYGKFDRVISSDAVWNSQRHMLDHLLDTICFTLNRSKEARLIIVVGYHTGRLLIGDFISKVISRGLVPDEEDPNLLGGIIEVHYDSKEPRKWTEELNKKLSIREDKTDLVTNWTLYAVFRWKDFV